MLYNKVKIDHEVREMQNVITEQAITNQIASAEMEGFCFSEEEVENVRKCLDGEITYQQFVDIVLAELKRA